MRTLFMVTMLATAVPDRPDLSPTDHRPLQEKIRGEWQMVNSVINAQPQDPNSHRATVYTFTANQLVTRTMKQPEPTTFGIVIDETHKPAHIDFVAGSGGSKTAYPGIFKIDGDVLTLCFTRAVVGQRPTEFASPADTQQMIALFQFKRISR